MLRKSFIIISLILNLIRKKWRFIRKIFSNIFVCFKKSRTFAPVKHRGVEQLVARWAHNPKVIRSSRISATTMRIKGLKTVYPHFFNSHQGQKKMFAQIMFVQIASTLPPPLHIPLFIGITDAVEATQKCGSKICFHTVSQTEILTHKKLTWSNTSY